LLINTIIFAKLNKKAGEQSPAFYLTGISTKPVSLFHFVSAVRLEFIYRNHSLRRTLRRTAYFSGQVLFDFRPLSRLVRLLELAPERRLCSDEPEPELPRRF
jgi:hypothetical protein